MGKSLFFEVPGFECFYLINQQMVMMIVIVKIIYNYYNLQYIRNYVVVLKFKVGMKFSSLLKLSKYCQYCLLLQLLEPQGTSLPLAFFLMTDFTIHKQLSLLPPLSHQSHVSYIKYFSPLTETELHLEFLVVVMCNFCYPASIHPYLPYLASKCLSFPLGTILSSSIYLVVFSFSPAPTPYLGSLPGGSVVTGLGKGMTLAQTVSSNQTNDCLFIVWISNVEKS